MRKVIQYFYETSGSGGEVDSLLHCFCNDGTVWYLYQGKWKLYKLPEIPQDENINEKSIGEIK